LPWPYIIIACASPLAADGDRMAAGAEERQLLQRCASVARAPAGSAGDRREANVLRVASMVVRWRFAGEADRLLPASDHGFADHPEDRLEPAEVIRCGWVVSLPRLRDRLERALHASSTAH
jgi:hypothetical protein